MFKSFLDVLDGLGLRRSFFRILFLTSALILTWDSLKPEDFSGLPVWFLPATSITLVLSGVVCMFQFGSLLIAAVNWALSPVVWGGNGITRCVKQFVFRAKLRRLSILEVFILSCALALRSRRISWNPDSPIIIEMVSKGLLEWVGSSLECYGCASFEIPEMVWVELFKMNEFRLVNPEILAKAAGVRGYSENDVRRDFLRNETLLQLLPKGHRAVQRTLHDFQQTRKDGEGSS